MPSSETFIDLIKTGKLSSTQMLEAIKLSEDHGKWKVAQTAVETNKLSPEEMFECIRLTSAQSDFVQMVVEKFDWSKPSPEQMFEYIKLSRNNGKISAAVAREMRLRK